MHHSISSDAILRSLALSVARNNVGAARPIHEIITSEGLTQPEYDAMAANPQFQRYVDAYTTDLKENGYSFAAKSKVLAEDLLPTAYHMVLDPDTPAAVRAKILENLVEWADLKPKKTSEDAAGPGFSITFNIPGASVQATLAKPPAADVIDVATVPELAAIPTFTTPQRTPIALSEPDDYEYGGEDYI